MRQTRLLRLSHHRHSARLLPHHHTSYGALLALLGILGVIVVVATLGVALPTKADSGDITVSGVVPGPPPTNAPNITAPANGAQTTNSQITVQGTCSPNATVVLMDNGAVRGSAICGQNGVFSITMSLAPGANQLSAHYVDSLNQSGPSSATITVTYLVGRVSSVPGKTSGSGSSVAASQPQLTITAPYRFNPVRAHTTFTLNAQVDGGIAPYAVEVDWGDGTQSLVSRAATGSFTLDHAYSRAGKFTIKLSVIDVAKTTAVFQTALAVIGTGVSIQPEEPSSATVTPAYQLIIIWPLFLAICLLVIGFWMGEYYARHSDRHSSLSTV